jgi:uncharacterized protein YfdQ (DUF2303 family)
MNGADEKRQGANGSDIGAAVAAGATTTVAENRVFVLTNEGSEIPIGVRKDGEPFLMREVLDQFETERHKPRRRQGRFMVHELESFVDFVNRYQKAGQSVVYVDIRGFTATCVFNEHPAGAEPSEAGWRDHSVTYLCPRAREWQIWTAQEGKPMSQEAFAQFIESNLENLVGGAKDEGMPLPTDVLEMTRDLQVHTTGTFKRKFDPTTGTGSLECSAEHGYGSTKIPKAFLLALRVFEGGQTYRVEARPRFEIKDGRALFSYQLHRRAEIESDAFGDVRKRIAEATRLPVFAGAVVAGADK